ncbi:hypothetical protein [Lusitaniella coriacea]|uniref:hypothetical protein n=1 Tax=Lusitaniella coriacea TaxID=1983105 RepID=UPI003CF39760
MTDSEKLINECNSFERVDLPPFPPGNYSLVDPQEVEKKQRDRLDKCWQEQLGYSYTEYEQQQEPIDEAALNKKQQFALKEGLPIEELPMDIDPDEYWDYRAKYPG